MLLHTEYMLQDTQNKDLEMKLTSISSYVSKLNHNRIKAASRVIVKETPIVSNLNHKSFNLLN